MNRVRDSLIVLIAAVITVHLLWAAIAPLLFWGLLVALVIAVLTRFF